MTACDVPNCDGPPLATWTDHGGKVWCLCEDCGDWARSKGWDYVSEV